MNFLSKLQAARVSRVLMGGAALAIAAAVGSFAPAVSMAQPKAQYNNGSGCTIQNFSYDSSTNTLTLTCVGGTSGGGGGTVTPVPGPSVYSITGTTSSATTGTTVTTTISRTGGNSAESLDVNATANGLTNWSFNGVGSNYWHTLSFALGEMSKTLSFSTGSTTGSLVVTLGGVIGSSGSYPTGAPQTINVTQGSGGGTIPPGCSTSANQNATFVQGSQKVTFGLKPGESGAIAFTPTASSSFPMTLQSSETVNTPPDADHEITVSTCPGDFNVAYPCRFQANYVGNSLTVSANATPWQCAVTPGTTYYMNVRQIKLRNSQSDPVINSCNPPYGGSSCEVRLQNYGL